MVAFTVLAAFVWGILVAVFMQFTKLGRFLSVHQTWFMTALGCGGNLLLLLLLMDGAGRVAWWHVVALFGVSSVGPSVRGLLQHRDYFGEIIDAARTTPSE